MSIVSSFYGSVQEANDYFDARLHEKYWTKATPADRPRALRAATIIIDTLAYKGEKAAVAAYKASIPLRQQTDEAIRSADATQELEFPRGTDTDVPQAIRTACYEIAHSLLSGKDPERELEKLGISTQGFEGVRTAYDRSNLPVEHIVNGVPNALAWRLILPFLRDDNAIQLSRVS
jgi:hypothetical protein